MANAFNPGQGVPGSLIAGDAWAWRADGLAAVYPAPAYSLAYHLAPRAGGPALVAPATPDADGFLVSVAATATAALVAGPWVWALRVTRASDAAAVTEATGCVEICPNPSSGADTRSQARRLLDAINAVLERRAGKDVDAYTIEGRSLTRIPFAELRATRARLLREVAAEDGGGPGGGLRHRKVRFRNV
jgi:hypothetical protein